MKSKVEKIVESYEVYAELQMEEEISFDNFLNYLTESCDMKIDDGQLFEIITESPECMRLHIDLIDACGLA